jgi:hypothetical protein
MPQKNPLTTAINYATHGSNDWRSRAVSAARPLYTLKTPGAGYIGGPMIYEGSVIPAPEGTFGDGSTAVYDDRSIIALSETANRLLITGVYGNSVAECQYPTSWSMSSSLAALSTGTITQNFRNAVPLINQFGDPRILGMRAMGGQNLVGGVSWYDNFGAPQNYMRYSNAANLASGAQVGMFRADGGRHNAGWTIDVPAEFQADLGCTHLQGFGGGISILFTTVAGISMYGVNAADFLTAAANDQIDATPLADYTVVDGVGMSGNMYTSEMWNFLSCCVGFFFIPGTWTIMAVGGNWVGPTYDPRSTNDILYKGEGVVDENGDDFYGGFFAYHINNYADAYWLYDVRRLIEVKQGTRLPSQVLPYEWDILPDSPFTRRQYGESLLGSALWHPSLARMFATSRRGVTGVAGGLPTLGKYKLAGVGS